MNEERRLQVSNHKSSSEDAKGGRQCNILKSEQFRDYLSKASYTETRIDKTLQDSRSH